MLCLETLLPFFVNLCMTVFVSFRLPPLSVAPLSLSIGNSYSIFIAERKHQRQNESLKQDMPIWGLFPL